MMRRAIRALATGLALTLTTAAALGAQERTLHWPLVTVEARLDADGRLHVRERQVMRFNGEWNGGQRRFDARLGQDFSLRRIARVDPLTGAEKELTAGDLSDVDEFDWAEGMTVRWRSRLPSDPPFDGTEITYVLEFTYGNILIPQKDGTYRLHHDFVFADREGDFDRFEFSLALDPAWRAPEGTPGVGAPVVKQGMPPGVVFVVTAPLTYLGEGRPAAVHFGAAAGTRLLIAIALAAVLLVLFAELLLRERRLGRFTPPPSRNEMTPAWFDTHVFQHLPEVVGAAWDDHTAAPEVAATLARLVQEKKLESSVKSKKIWIFSNDVLHLRLLVPRSQFGAHERVLIDALFNPGSERTDTTQVRERYSKTGFDPAALIRNRLAQLVENTTPGAKGEKPSRKPTLLLLAIAIALIVAGVSQRALDGGVAIVVMGASLPIYFVAAVFAYGWQRSVTGLALGTLSFVVPVAVMAGLFTSILLIAGRFQAGTFVLAGLAVWITALANSVFNIARARHSAERIAVRQRLSAAREYFRDELAKQQPQLRDEWFPYLIAFGLGRHIDKWFRAFGGTADAMAATSIARSTGSSGSSGGGSSWTGFGGGGGFSGGGASASFAAAVGGMAASVPSPSSGGSSGGGGGGGGGGSSGGGGGGGW